MSPRDGGGDREKPVLNVSNRSAAAPARQGQARKKSRPGWRRGRRGFSPFAGFAATLVIVVLSLGTITYIALNVGTLTPYPATSPTTQVTSSTTHAQSTSSSTGTSSSPYTIGVANSTALGSYLVDSGGAALYYFAPDTVGNATSPPVSACTASLDCTQVWPVFYASKIVVAPGLSASDFTTFTRSDGSNQTAYMGHPLYLYIGDTGPGTTNGQGVDANGGYWYVVPTSPGATFTSSG